MMTGAARRGRQTRNKAPTAKRSGKVMTVAMVESNKPTPTRGRYFQLMDGVGDVRKRHQTSSGAKQKMGGKGAGKDC